MQTCRLCILDLDRSLVGAMGVLLERPKRRHLGRRGLIWKWLILTLRLSTTWFWCGPHTNDGKRLITLRVSSPYASNQQGESFRNNCRTNKALQFKLHGQLLWVNGQSTVISYCRKCRPVDCASWIWTEAWLERWEFSWKGQRGGTWAGEG